MADMTEKEVDLHRGLLKEKKSKKSKKFKSSTLPFNQSAMHTDLVPDQLDWREYGTQTNILDQFHVELFLANGLTSAASIPHFFMFANKFAMFVTIFCPRH